MEITGVRIFLRNDEKLKGFATVTFDDCFIIRDLKVINGNNGLFIAMPSRKRKDGTFRDVAHPLNNETRKKIEDRVLEEYQKEVAKGPPPEAERQPEAQGQPEAEVSPPQP